MSATLPLPFVLKAGSKASLGLLISEIFGSEVEDFDQYAFYSYGRRTADDLNFSYWNPRAPSVGQWIYQGDAVPSETYGGADPGTLDKVQFKAGNVIWNNAYLWIANDGASNAYHIATVFPSVARKGMEKGMVDPSDVVAAARKLNKLYDGIDNPNDCHWIAATAAAAAGAVLSQDTTNTNNPRLNEEYGFWRIAYRGTDPDSTSDWSRLLEAGDIVRMGWKGGGFHTATVLSVNRNGSFEVFDNAAGNGEIGIHTVRYDAMTVAKSITIYRLSDDHLFLVEGTKENDRLSGTLFTDKLVGGAGDDTLGGGLKHDVLVGGRGADRLHGGGAADWFVYEAVADSGNTAGGADTIEDFGSSDRIDLRAIDADLTAQGNQRFTFIGSENFSGKAGELRYTPTDTGADILADVDGDGDADFLIHVDQVSSFGKADIAL